MSYIKNPDKVNSDIIGGGNVKNNSWYSAAVNPVNDEEGLSDYCGFCLTNFRQFNPMMHNVCQSCGRVAEPVMRDDQENIKVTSLNSSVDDELRTAASIEYDYSPIFDIDPTIDGIPGANQRMSANSAGEAIRKINTVERSRSKIAAAALRNERFLIKTDLTKDKKVYFDSNL